MVATLTAAGVISVEIPVHPGFISSSLFNLCRPLDPCLLPHCFGLWWVFWDVLLFIASDTVPLCVYIHFALGYVSLWGWAIPPNVVPKQVIKPSSHAQSLCSSRLWNLLKKPKWERKNTENISAYNSSLVRRLSQGSLILPRTQTNTLFFIGEALLSLL